MKNIYTKAEIDEIRDALRITLVAQLRAEESRRLLEKTLTALRIIDRCSDEIAEAFEDDVFDMMYEDD